MAGNTSRPGASVVSRVLALLGAFDETHRRLTLTELARRADLPVPTAHRLIGELTAHGALARTPSGEYVVGRQLWSLGVLAPVQTGLLEAASPFLHDLYAATLATVHLAVRDGTEVLYLDRLSGRRACPVDGPARAGPERRVRHHCRGDDPGRLLGRGPCQKE